MDGYASPHELGFKDMLCSFCRICSVIFHRKIWSQWFSAVEEQCRKEEAID